MKKSIFILAFFIFSFSLLATEKITLKPDGVPVYSQPTDTGKKILNHDRRNLFNVATIY